MSTDRELLELAAKAAGYRRMKYFDDVPHVSVDLHGEDWWAWNPLADDGDALRLAVKLSIDVFNRADKEGNVAARIFITVPWMIESEASDKGAAVRRAIVRAAAAIGKKMP